MLEHRCFAVNELPRGVLRFDKGGIETALDESAHIQHWSVTARIISVPVMTSQLSENNFSNQLKMVHSEGLAWLINIGHPENDGDVAFRYHRHATVLHTDFAVGVIIAYFDVHCRMKARPGDLPLLLPCAS